MKNKMMKLIEQKAKELDAFGELYVEYRREEGFFSSLNKIQEKIVTNTSFQELGSGAWRLAFTHIETPGVVYKLSFPHVNISEYLYYQDASMEMRKLLAPIYYTTGFVNVQQYIPYGTTDEYSTDNAYDHARGVFKKWGVSIPDMHGDNVRFVNRNLEPTSARIIDYAYNSSTKVFKHKRKDYDFEALTREYPTLKSATLITYFKNL